MVTSGKYFIAVVLRGRALDATERIKQSLLTEFNLKGALRSPAHITLHRPFAWKTNKEEQLLAELHGFFFEPSFDLSLSGFSHFGDRVIYVSVQPEPALDKLHRALTTFCKTRLHLLNEYEDLRGFHPHVTVASRDLRRRQFEEVWSFLRQTRVSESQAVSGFSLLRLEDKWNEICFFPFRTPGA